jgi:tetratricopeptide (TPR) repeat protein
MALDFEQTRRNAERFLKQGRVQAALEEYQRLAEETPRDLPLLNLVGDLLSRVGRHRDAAAYYERIAEEYAQSGFFLKAIAILKKVLRNEPGRADVLLRVGDLYLRQKLPGEARSYLLQAGERFVAARAFPRAYEVYLKLVEAEPGDPLHRLRLAETLAAGGDGAGASASLVAVAESARSAGRPAEAEKIFRRALELVPGGTEALAGFAHCLAAQGKASEAAALLGRALESRREVGLVVALLSIEEQAGRDDEVLRVLTGPFADGIPDDAFERVVRSFVERRKSEAAWSALDPLVARWTHEAPDRLARLLDRLARVEPDGHLPALQRLHDLQRGRADGMGVARTLEALERAYRARSMDEEAARVVERLREIAPAARTAPRPAATGEARDAAAARPVPGSGPATAAEEASGPADAATAPIPAGIETPAIPHGPADDEVVAGRLTQAEIFEKYGLYEQAIEQLREVTRRFPGLASAQQRLAGLLRARGDGPALRDALVGLAIAYRASGEHDRARGIADEAARAWPLDPGTRALLERLSLLEIEGRAAPESPEAPPAPTEKATVSAPGASAGAPAPAVPRRATPSPARPGEDEIVIDLEEESAVHPEAVPAPESAAPTPPAPDDLEEIAFYLDQGMVEDARHRIVVLRTRGIGGAALDALEARAAVTAAPSTEEDVLVETVDRAAVGSETILDDEALASLSEALGASAEVTATAPVVFEEQSVEAVFELFKQHVNQQIGREDYRTHYDLGIAYKEMSLLDDAVAEFETASRAPELFRDACSMIAMCYREKGEVREAARWYRQALDAPGDDEEALRGLRFDLAEVLDQCGDTQAALDLFRSIDREDPSYREVGQRISEIENRGH